MSNDVDLKATIQLPRTRFSMKANLPRREPETLDWWDRIDLYGRIRQSRQGAPSYVLHDGPPYANGNIHLGQALNKILKDMVVKSRTMMGRDARYVPGWDCHGLPIENRVDRELGPEKAALNPLEFRRLCREYAERFVGIQRDEFRRIGVLWDRARDADEEQAGAPSRRAIYRTLDRSYEAEIVRQIGRFFCKPGAIYHGVKPVHWCTSCRTALAEAEVEYADRTDPSIYVKFPVSGLERRVPELAGRRVSLLIWTTTPWTLPANLAVALHPDLAYVAVEVDGETYIVAEALLGAVGETVGWTAHEIVARFTGRDLVGEGPDWIDTAAPLERPYLAASGPAAEPGVLILGSHVTLDAGTGCVHTAPGHGADDFAVGQRYGLETFNPVGDDGHFLSDLVGQDWLQGVFVLQANALILDDLRGRGLLLHSEDHAHSYPHCWRCKKPVLFRSTPQWFISMEVDGLRGKALEQIKATRWLPEFGEDRIAGMIENRPDWCISRQRTWGVPVPAVVCSRCFEQHPDAFVREPAFFEHLATLFEAEGSDAWFGVADGAAPRPYSTPRERLDRLVPAQVSCPHCGRREDLSFHEHVVDVWFESGVSHSAVLGGESELPWPADLYLEGHDQYRGWFHSSLLVAVNDRAQAPYRGVVTHGFTVDGQGRKMSKSMGNVVSPMDVAGKRGAEILRMWTSMVDFLEDMRLSEETLDRNTEAYRKIRNTFRYLLGNLRDFDPERDRVAYDSMEEIDRWTLQRLEQLRGRVVSAYETHQYHVVYHGIHNFCGVTLSSFYLDIIKDRLYTFPPRHPARRSAQTVLYRLADELCRLMAPVLCFTAEEIWQELELLRGREAWQEASVHTQRFPEPLEAEQDQALLQRWERLMKLREEIYKALETARADKLIGTGLEAHLIVEAPEETVEFLRSFGDSLPFLLLTSSVEMAAADTEGLAVQVRRAAGDKCLRCWNYTTDVGNDAEWPGICARCSAHVREIVAEANRA